MAAEHESFTLRIGSDRDGRTVLRLIGELDMEGAPRLKEVVHQLQHDGAPELIVDLRGLTFLDSMGLSALVEAHAAGQDGHRSISFIRGSSTVQRVFSITEVDKRVNWVDPPV
jgi:anti-anti-sigma factor